MFEILFLPIQFFIVFPYLAFLMAGYFGYPLYRLHQSGGAKSIEFKKPRLQLIAVTGVWVVFGLVELAIQLGQAADEPPPNIRIDLLVSTPILYAAFIVGVIARKKVVPNPESKK